MRKHLKDYFIPHNGNDYKPHSVRTLSLGIVTMVAVIVTIMALVGSNIVHRTGLLAQVQAALLTQITNDDRADANVGTLTVNPLLERAAELKAADMIKYQYFAHTSPQGKDPWYWVKKAGYDYQYAGENLAIDFYDTKQVAQAWMDSPTHRKNILNGRYKEIGIAVEDGWYEGRRVAFVVQMFGTKKIIPTATLVDAPIDTESETDIEEVSVLTQADQTDESDTQILGEAAGDSPVPEAVEEVVQEVVETVVESIPTSQEIINDNSSFVETIFTDPISDSPQKLALTTPEEEPFVSPLTDTVETLGDDDTNVSLTEGEVDLEDEIDALDISPAESIQENTDTTPVVSGDAAVKGKTYSKLVLFLARPGFVGKVLLIVLGGLVGLSLLFKIIFEYRRQHYTNVVLALLVLVILVILYLILSQHVAQVIVG